MFFLLWLSCNVFLHLALALLYVEYTNGYSDLPPATQIQELKDSFYFIRERFLDDAFWIEADKTEGTSDLAVDVDPMA